MNDSLRKYWTPAFQIKAEKQDITHLIKERLISLRVTDEADLKSDDVEIVLDDRDAAFELPKPGAQLEIALGYEETNMIRMGLYQVDEVELSGPAMQMTIRGKAANFAQGTNTEGKLQTQKNRSWDSTSIEEIVNQIAEEHEYEARVDEDLKNIPIEHMDQTSESDLNFLLRLAQLNGAILKPTNDYLCFTKDGIAETTSGQTLSDIPLHPENVFDWRVTIMQRNTFSLVKAKWHNKQTARTEIIKVGEGEPVFEFDESFCDEATARRAVEGKLAKSQRSEATLSLNMPGLTTITAKSKLILNNFRAGVNGNWVCKRVTHELSSSGLTTSIEAETDNSVSR